ncbi:hypothetical protein [Mangrovimonas sp. DI 80]|uniref:hypothetical protein n=1 Tax=Mangrovimonas sp. DI 80 TaxID=1779330 RepID=UPI0009754C3B|nr:hypothetical protein [Mangrovimonas sp. DI 80]OMP31905.1 hypothetical protein BKM32_02255 [Mangrovimonas sp. DI 80]
MSVAKSISLRKVNRELDACRDYAKKCGWLISDIDEPNQSFTVKMKSPIDNELFILKVVFEDYPEYPLILEFLDPDTGEEGTRKAYPNGRDSFFHKRNPPFICNPCSRKAYRTYSPKQGPHGDWSMTNWRDNPKTGSLTTICEILKVIYSRISNERYYNGGRME